jgi:glycerol-3-phosphate acyltransferase PlsY
MALPLTPPSLLALMVAAYAAGSVPFGVIVTRLGGAGDVRAIGSGNIGATNVLRTGRRDLALLTLLGDGGKGAVAVLLARAWFGQADGDLAAAVAGGAAFVGHIFPVWLKFRGGKGVATFFGVMLAAAWPLGALAGLTWIVIAAVLRWSSLASLTAAALTPVLALVFGETPPLLALSLFTAVLIYYRHRENIGRLIKGDEPRIGARRAERTPA